MIRNNKLAYAASEPVFLYWASDNSVVNTLLIPVLTTLLSNLIISIIFDFLFGFKPRRQAPVSDINSMVLVQNPSPLAILSSISRSDFLTRLRLKVSSHTPIDRSNKKMPYLVGIKLLGLLVLAPIVNIISVTMALESDTVISLRAARFNGVAIGIAEQPNSVLFDPLSEKCDIARIELKQGEEPLSGFSVCSFSLTRERPNRLGIASIEIIRAFGLIGFGLSLNGRAVDVGKMGYFRTEVNGTQRSFYLPMKVDADGLNNLANLGIGRLAKECGVDPKSAVDTTGNFTYPDTGTEVLKSKTVKCEKDGDEMQRVATFLIKYLTLVNSEDMCVSEIAHSRYGNRLQHECYDGADFPLFVRRRRNVSLLTMAVCVAACTVLHIFTSFTGHNDVSNGVQVLLKKAVGLKPYDSALFDYGIYVNYNGGDNLAPAHVHQNDPQCNDVAGLEEGLDGFFARGEPQTLD